jgi:hypothetical protein
MTFATTTLRHLAKLEEKALREKSGLRLFCRMDLGVIQYAEHKFHYWVNEVDRTPNATLFACGATHWTQTLARAFAKALPEFVSVNGD